ncbi:YibE/F family protein [Petroclostridium sp. X23]|uniref:YibE/F family protein n=1 Tax=Petroclostridium sp. X23 TaxID=3045146 RepID=UPI0024ACDB98|nr:YibE/F family protein [Petroclostridium sp. X23]WHH58240.1 YibE/F family protein [Petroclostridium sp. X23]
MLNSKTLRAVLWTITLISFSLFLYFFNKGTHISFNKQGGISYVRYEKAKVLRVVSESSEKDEAINGLYRGFQQLEVQILTGEHKGELHIIKNYLSNLLNVYGKAGQNIIVCVDTANPEKYLVSVYNYDRSPVLYIFILLFLAALWGIGGKKGFKSMVGLLFTFICIIFLFIPMLYRGYSPIFASVLIVIITTCITLLTLNGWSFKTLSAVLGTTLGVVIAGTASSIAGHFAHITGFQTEEVETLIVIARDHGMQVGGLLFAGILIASLGAIMDVAMSIASSVQEVYIANHNLSKNALFMSGINVGRDMMGTMANTLLLAFTGTSLNSLILIYSYNVPYNELINMNMLGIEIIQGLSGSTAVILTVPIIAFISSRLIPMRRVENSYRVSATKKHNKANHL